VGSGKRFRWPDVQWTPDNLLMLKDKCNDYRSSRIRICRLSRMPNALAKGGTLP
jgi:hypothetical protein